ncbi:PH and SEC7 domain-containing protein 2 [Hippocampus zosterae]|uniref:PH and SEC7 domain-containing protein 2 n=1 Tax=Hippocampus zosterae TaxID=109293 RepID=UPI00223DE627|nr:PH and SEC7 domain-containing protein 2 [Hippocampus zosterae]XP_051907753.1 PH and SEC7 domain-containing protein 2 [Hippocampus zosterae]
MEEDRLASPHLDLTDLDPWRPHDLQHLNGEAKDEIEETIWLRRPVSCSTVASCALPFATVQWEIPDGVAQRPSSRTGRESGDGISSSPLGPFHGNEAERKEERDGTDSSVNLTGNDFKPCDAAAGQEPTTQQREHSPHRLLGSSHNAVSFKSDLEEEEEDSVTSDAVSTTADLRTEEPREEQEEELKVLMTQRAHSAGPQTSFQGAKMADESQVGSASNVSRLDECVSNNVEAPELPKQTDNNGPSLEVLAEGTPSQKVPAADGSEGKPQTFSQDNRLPPKHCDDSVHLGQPQLSEKTHSSIQFVDSAVKESEVETKASHQNQAKDVASLLLKVSSRALKSNESHEVAIALNGSGPVLVTNVEPGRTAESATPHMNGGDMDREKAFRLAERLFKLEGIQRVDVVKHFDKDNSFSRAVGEEYLRFFDFTGQTLDQALRSFLKVVMLLGETQERERVLQHFADRFHHCNPDSFSSPGAVLAITCALMLLNTDLHGQNVGKAMSSSRFVSNLEGMNDGQNFSKDLLKGLYNSIKSEPLQWAVDEQELTSVWMEEVDAPLRSKSNPFQDVPHDKTAPVVKQGFIQRKLHADIDGKRTPWGKRRWKTFYGVLKGMVLYLQKDHSRGDQQSNEEVVSVHHSLAEPAADYTKKPYVFRLQTADWRVFLFQASSKMEMTSWISRINLVSALHSSPPFPAAVGSQRRFCRPILPASQSAHTLERQLQSHAGMLESFQTDLSYLQQNPPEGKKARGKEMEEHRTRAEYLQHEICRYESYTRVLEAWKGIEKTGDGAFIAAVLSLFDKAMCASPVAEEGEDDADVGRLTKSQSSPSLDIEMAPQSAVRIKRNVSERWTYRRVAPRLNKDA